jgi:hypothetical protein
MDRYTLAELERIPTQHQGQYDDLKVDTGQVRVWLSRLGIEDGMPYNNQVTHERLLDGVWTTEREYEAR